MTNKTIDPTYWEDYSVFLKRVQELTMQSPASLLESYQELIEHLSDGPYDFCRYEFDHDMRIREQIETVIQDSSLNDNRLAENFSEKVNDLDCEFRKFVKTTGNQKEWWKGTRLK